jgi:opacity protein-like surface antigen
MKKILLVALLGLFTSAAVAQTKGQSILGPGFSTYKNSDSSNDFKYTSNNFSLNYGLFVKDNARLGVDLGYTKYLYSYNSPYKETITTTSLGLNYKKFYPIIDKFYWTLAEAASYGWGDKEVNSSGTITTYKVETMNTNVVAGLSYFLSKRFMIEADGPGLYLSSTKTKSTTKVSKNSSFSYNNYLNLKVNFIF